MTKVWQRFRLLIGLVAIALFKLWVIHLDEIYGSSTEYDALWYVGSAKHWYWGATYSWTGFVRPCAYPVFIAVLHFLGIPLRIGIEFMQMAGWVVLIAALRKAALPRLLCLGIYALMVLHPATMHYNNHTMSDSFYAAILPLALGGSLLTLFTNRFRHAIWTGAAYAVLWNTREESFLIPPILIVLFLLALWQRRETATRKTHFIFWTNRIGALAAALSILVAAIYSANYKAFHSFAKSDMSSPAFEKVFKALLRIKPDRSMQFVSVHMDSLRRAFEASPTFALLKPQFEAPVGQVWTHPLDTYLGIHEYGPWFMWALRNVTAASGFYQDPASTNRFYRRVAREINDACDQGKLPSRVVLTSFLDPGAVSRIGETPAAIPRIAKLFLFRTQKVMVRADTNLFPWMSELYTEMVFRKPQPKIDESNAVVIPDTISAKAAVAVENFIGANYVYLFTALSWLALGAFLLLLWFARRLRLSDPINAALVLLGFTIGMRILFFSFLDATWWRGGYERYLFPVMPLASCFLVLLVSQAVAVWKKSAAPNQ